MKDAEEALEQADEDYYSYVADREAEEVRVLRRQIAKDKADGKDTTALEEELDIALMVFNHLFNQIFFLILKQNNLNKSNLNYQIMVVLTQVTVILLTNQHKHQLQLQQSHQVQQHHLHQQMKHLLHQLLEQILQLHQQLKHQQLLQLRQRWQVLAKIILIKHQLQNQKIRKNFQILVVKITLQLHH